MSGANGMRIALIGCGEVGLIYGRALHEAGKALVLCDLRVSNTAREFAVSASAPLHETIGEWLREADVVISAVFGSVSLAVAEQSLSKMKAGALFIDMTTADPATIRTAAQVAVAHRVDYADVAILGAVALSGKHTNLLAAGTGAAAAAALFAEISAPMKLLEDGAAGDAAALKILRSVFTKGLEALTIECFVAAEAQGLTDKLHDALSDIDKASLRDFLEALVRTHVLHAPRRLKEVEEAERQLRVAGLPVAVLPGVANLFARTSEAIATNPIGTAEPTVAQAFAWLRNNGECARLETLSN